MSTPPWKTELHDWLKRRRSIAPATPEDFERFFEQAFLQTRCVDRAWFGSNKSAISLMVGNIYLAALNCSGNEQGVWLLLDQHPPALEGFDFRPVKSTRSSPHPLTWAHSPLLSNVTSALDNQPLWDSFARASEKILASGVSHDRNKTNNDAKKTRLRDILVPQAADDPQQFEQAVQASLQQTPAARRERLRNAPVMPLKKQVLSTVYVRNPDVVAAVLFQANGHCGRCEKPAPFKRKSDNTPYLEVHHKTPLASGGKDTVANAVALCPNCHRAAHHA